MPEKQNRVTPSRFRVVAVPLLVAVLAGLIVGGVAGSVMTLRTVRQNFIGFTTDSLLLGVYLVVIYGLVSMGAGAVIGAFFAIVAARGRDVGPREVFAGALGVLFAVYLFLTGMRLYNTDIYFYQYPFIRSYQVMQLFFVLRSALLVPIVLAAGYIVYRLSRRAPGRVIAALALIVIAAGVVVSLRSTRPPRETTTEPPALVPDASIPKIMLVGWDGATWVVIDRLLAAGKMPHTRRLIERGTRGNLKSPARTASPEIWTTIYTGKVGRKHGIYGFAYYILPGLKRPLVPPWRGLGVTRLITLALEHRWVDMVIANRSLRRATPIWRIMNGAGKSAGVVGALATWPAEETEPFLISSVAGDVARKVRKGKLTRGAFEAEDLFYPLELEESVRQAILADERWRESVGPYLYRKHYPDFFTIYFGEPDGTQHTRWKWMEPQYYADVTEEDLARYGGQIEHEYVRADSVLGMLLETAGDSTTVLVVSDHGFSPAYRGGIHQAGHYYGPNGILIACGPPILPGAPVENAHVNDITPTLLALAGLPVAEDMDGRVLDEIIRPEFLHRHPVTTTPTYETEASAKEVRQSQAEDELYEKLRALGYIGE